MPPSKKRAKPVSPNCKDLSDLCVRVNASLMMTIQRSTVRVKLSELKPLYPLFWNFVNVQGVGKEFKDKDGSRGWELGNKRRLSVTTFKGKKYIGIREYYEKDGRVIPLSLLKQANTSCCLGRGV